MNESSKKLSWSGLARRVYDGLPTAERRSVQLGAARLERAASAGSVPHDLKVAGKNLFVLPVFNGKVRMVTTRTSTGWTVVDISRPAGGFKFAPLSPLEAGAAAEPRPGKAR